MSVDDWLSWLSIALSVGAIALSIDSIRLTRKAKKLRAETARIIAAKQPLANMPRFATISECWAAVFSQKLAHGDRIGCAHCQWTGTATTFASHLLTCPED